MFETSVIFSNITFYNHRIFILIAVAFSINQDNIRKK